MKKKILALAMAVCLIAVAVTGFTLAYFTDTDSATNTMTSGSVKIEQYEKDRNGDEFEQEQTLIPAVYYAKKTVDNEEAWVPYNSKEGVSPAKDGKANDVDIWDKSVRNVIDKFVTVENTGSESAFVRTIFLIDDKKSNLILDEDVGMYWEYYGDAVKYNWNTDGITYSTADYVTINDVDYKVIVATYNEALAADEKSAPSLCQFYLDPTTENEWYDNMDSDNFNIRVLSQAVQEQGFDDAATALKIAFGDVTAENLADWFDLD